jgi:hypothetical protein
MTISSGFEWLISKPTDAIWANTSRHSPALLRRHLHAMEEVKSTLNFKFGG